MNDLRFLVPAVVPLAGARMFRVSTLSHALAALIVGAVVAACVWVGWRGGVALGRTGALPAFIAWWIVFWLGLYWLLVMNDWRKARGPHAWLAAAASDGVYIKWRSYQNAHWGTDDAQVVFIPYRLIAAVQEHHRWWLTPGDRGATRMERRSYVELRLDADTEALAQRLADERRSRPGGAARKRSTWRHFPLSVEPGNVLRIEWRARPRMRVFVDHLQGHGVAVEAAQTGTLDLTRTTDEAQLRELARHGDVMALVRALRRDSRMSLADAKAQAEVLIAQARIS